MRETDLCVRNEICALPSVNVKRTLIRFRSRTNEKIQIHLLIVHEIILFLFVPFENKL